MPFKGGDVVLGITPALLPGPINTLNFGTPSNTNVAAQAINIAYTGYPYGTQYQMSRATYANGNTLVDF